MFSLIAAVALTLLFVRAWRRDRRRLRNGYLLFGAVWFGIAAIGEYLTYVFPAFGLVLFGVIALLPLTVLVLAIVLIKNGVEMARRESRSLGNLLSLLAGLCLLAAPAVILWLALHPNAATLSLAALMTLVATYVGTYFVVFFGYAIVYSRASAKVRPDVIIVLGAGLIDDAVPPLLAGRLDRAIEIWRSCPTDAKPLLIPSGGQGDDEVRPEGEAMAEYLLRAGIPATHIAAETRSRNTEQNLLFSSEILRERAAGDQVLIVTSDYHVLRAAILAQRVGIAAEATGSRTARYFRPSAFLREFIAILSYSRGLNIAAACIVVLGSVAAGMFGTTVLR